MGQSMNSPKRSKARSANSRFSARSLYRSNRKSTLLEKKSSLSPSKMRHSYNYEQNSANLTVENA